MRIGIDFDDVLYPYHHYLRRRIAKKFGIDLDARAPRVTTFYYENLPELVHLGISREQIWAEVRAAWKETEAHAEAPLLDREAAGIIRTLRNKHEIVLISARSKDSRQYVDAFLRRHAIEPHKVLLGYHDKSGFDVLIDDFPEHAIQNAESGGHSLLYTIDENSSFDESRHARIERIHAWAEVPPALERIAAQRSPRG